MGVLGSAMGGGEKRAICAGGRTGPGAKGGGGTGGAGGLSRERIWWNAVAGSREPISYKGVKKKKKREEIALWKGPDGTRKGERESKMEKRDRLVQRQKKKEGCAA